MLRASVPPLLLSLALSGCALPTDHLVEAPRGDVRFESPRPLPLDRLPDHPPFTEDGRVAESGRVRAHGDDRGDVLFLRRDRRPPTTVAHLDLGDAPVTALVFGADDAARHLYVALADGHLRTVDVEAAGGPAVVDTLRTRRAVALAADGENLVLLTDEAARRVLRFDLWNPARPRLDGSIEVARAARVALVEGRLVLLDAAGVARAYRLAGATGTTMVHQSVNQ